ncbi:MAG: hypothetical protein HDT23_09085 [Ruminococcus sp.]|nr:hypothetical protein [Ruminococcus sp.]
MARTVDEVNESIRQAHELIEKQDELRKSLTQRLQSNSNEYNALQKQKDALDNTYSEIGTLCGTLGNSFNAMHDTYNNVNGFAYTLAGVAIEKINSVQSETLNKISLMIEKINSQMSSCSSDFEKAEEQMRQANTTIENAVSTIEELERELKEAQAEEEMNAMAGM